MKASGICHILFYVTNIQNHLHFPVGNLQQPELYAICIYVNQDVFSDVKPQDWMYGHGDFPSYRVDENCHLVHGWAKFTNAINGGNILHVKPMPVLTMLDVTTITSTCVGIEDCLNPILHSYIFSS